MTYVLMNGGPLGREGIKLLEGGLLTAFDDRYLTFLLNAIWTLPQQLQLFSFEHFRLSNLMQSTIAKNYDQPLWKNSRDESHVPC